MMNPPKDLDAKQVKALELALAGMSENGICNRLLPQKGMVPNRFARNDKKEAGSQ